MDDLINFYLKLRPVKMIVVTFAILYWVGALYYMLRDWSDKKK